MTAAVADLGHGQIEGRCPLLALSRHSNRTCGSLLLEQQRTLADSHPARRSLD